MLENSRKQRIGGFPLRLEKLMRQGKVATFAKETIYKLWLRVHCGTEMCRVVVMRQRRRQRVFFVILSQIAIITNIQIPRAREQS